ncbi:MAG TPA: glycosyltransferase family 4 protein [Pseudolabrys sp.]|jgi:glycosyltransferase involved in cell wall biosynthesis
MAMPISIARKPHIMVIGHSAGPVLHGSERSLLNILAAVDRQKYDLSCVLPERNDVYLQAVARHTENITVFPYRWWSGTPQGDPETVSRFEDIFRRGQVNLVHANTITMMDPLIAAKNVDVPSILHARELIFDNFALANKLGGNPSSIVRTVQANADFIIANSNATHRLYYKKDCSFRLYNCVDIDALDMPNEVDPGNLKIGIISGNHPAKGIELFVRLAIMAAQRRLGLEFMVIGPHTEHTEELARVVQDAKVPVNIRFMGYTANAVEAVRRVNVVVSFSVAPESFGRSLVEAMAARRPVIAFDGGGVPELVRHGTDGFLVPYPNFERALDHLEAMASNTDCIAVMGRNARARAEELSSPAAFASSLNGIYRRILETRVASLQ